MEPLSAKDLTLNIAVNLGRLGRFAMDGRRHRLDQFLSETERFVEELEKVSKSNRFQPTYIFFKEKFKVMKNNVACTPDWAEEAFTWANILSHRAKLT